MLFEKVKNLKNLVLLVVVGLVITLNLGKVNAEELDLPTIMTGDEFHEHQDSRTEDDVYETIYDDMEYLEEEAENQPGEEHDIVIEDFDVEEDLEVIQKEVIIVPEEEETEDGEVDEPKEEGQKPEEDNYNDNNDDEYYGSVIENIVKGKLNDKDHFAYIQGYTDGTVRPNSEITRAEVAAVLFRLLDAEYKEQVRSNTNNFTDVNDDFWANKHISTLVKAGIINGYEDGTFKPNQPITRAEMSAMMARFFNLKSNKSIFNDIKGHWAEKEVNALAEKGWIKGYGAGVFLPNNNLTRAEFVTMMNNILNRKVNKNNILEGTITFTDLKANTWYFNDIVESTNSHKYEEVRLEDGTEVWTSLEAIKVEM